MGHSCRTLLWDIPVGHTLRTRLPPKVTLRGCKTSVSYETYSKSHASSLKNERFVRDFLQKSHVKSQKRAFRTRLPPKVTCQVPKTSVSYETSSKTHMSKSAKRTFRTRLPPKVQRKHPSEHTHHAALPSSFAIPAPPNNIRSHANPNVQRHSPLPQLTTSRFPAPATNLSASTRLTRAKYCACHEMSPPSHLATSPFPAPATRIALPRLKTHKKYCACHEKWQYHLMSASTKFAPHHTFGMISTHSEHTPIHQNRHFS